MAHLALLNAKSGSAKNVGLRLWFLNSNSSSHICSFEVFRTRSCRNKEEEETVPQLLGTCPVLCQRRRKYLGAYYMCDLGNCRGLTYIHIHTELCMYCNPSVRITTWLLTPLMLCTLILYKSDETYSLTSTPNHRFLRNFFMAGLLTLKGFARNLSRFKLPKKYFHIFVLLSDLDQKLQMVSRLGNSG